MSPVLIVGAAVTVVVAAVRSTWSPCGWSMLSTITPLTERGRGHRFGATASWFVGGAVLGGALCYAVSAILARLRPPQAALPTSALVILLATLLTLPLAAATAPPPSLWPTRAEVLSVIGLGVFSTAAAAVLYFRLIASAGPSFAAQLNYLIPPWAVLMGIAFLGESPQPNHFYALALILAGVLIAASARHSPTAALPPQRRGP